MTLRGAETILGLPVPTGGDEMICALTVRVDSVGVDGLYEIVEERIP